MNSMRIVFLCISAAMICTSVRAANPQIASAVALATGVAALMISLEELDSFQKTIVLLDQMAETGSWGQINLLKLCGVAVVAEFASDICRDAGERALAHRIDMGVKLSMVVAALPIAAEVLEKIEGLTT